MTDIVERLREPLSDDGGLLWARLMDERNEAADEIERLRAALEPFACHCDDGDLCKHPHVCRHYIARAALTATPAPKKEDEP